MTRREVLVAGAACASTLWARGHWDKTRISAITDEIGLTTDDSIAFAHQYGLQFVEVRDRKENETGQIVESTGPIVLGTRLETSQEPRAWRAITYGKGSWIIQMLHQRMGDERFFPMLAELLKRYDHKEVTTEQFRELAAQYLPPKSEDAKLEAFFEQWVYGTGVPNLKLSYTLKGKAPAFKLVGTLTQSDVDEDFSALTPVEIQLGRGRTITKWVASASTPVSFTVPLTQAPLKVSLDPHHAVLRR